MHWLQMDSLQRLLQNLRSWYRGLLAREILAQDARYAFRTFRRNPGFALVAVLILALGIGANVAVFSVVNTILLHPLPFHDPQQLAWFAGNNGSGGLSDTTYQIPAYEAYQRSNRSFQELTAFVPYYSLSETKLIGRGEPKPVSFVWVAGNFFQTLGIQPAVGRLFTSDESVKGGSPAVLLSYPFWQRQFGANPAIVGQSIRLDQDVVTVVGVLPSTFDFGAVFAPGSKMDFFRPAVMENIRTWGHMVSVVGRLKPGLSALSGCCVDNVIVEMNASEPPILDGSARPFVNLIIEGEPVEQDRERDYYALDAPVSVARGNSSIIALPHDGLKISCTSADDRGTHTQHMSMSIDPETYVTQIAPARTFTFYEDIEELLRLGKIRGGSLDCAVVIKGDKVMSKEPLRFKDEFVRHKILDIIGDVSLLGMSLKAHIVAIRPGHALNSELTKVIFKRLHAE